MIRFLLLLLLVYVLYRVFTWKPISPGKKKIRHPDAEEMVACANCGTFVSKREAESRNGQFYCKPRCQR